MHRSNILKERSIQTDSLPYNPIDDLNFQCNVSKNRSSIDFKITNGLLRNQTKVNNTRNDQQKDNKKEMDTILDLSLKPNAKDDFISFDYVNCVSPNNGSARTPRTTELGDKSNETRMKSLLDKLNTLLRSSDNQLPTEDDNKYEKEFKLIQPPIRCEIAPLDDHCWFKDSRYRHEYYNPFRTENVPNRPIIVKQTDAVDKKENTENNIEKMENNIEKIENNIEKIENTESLKNIKNNGKNIENVIEKENVQKVENLEKENIEKENSKESCCERCARHSSVLESNSTSTMARKKRSTRVANSRQVKELQKIKINGRGTFIRVGLSLIYVSIFLILFGGLTIPKFNCLL